MLVLINNQWQSLNTLSGYAVGTALLVQSQSANRVYVKQQTAQPSERSLDGVTLSNSDLWQVTSGSLNTWVKVDDTSGQLFVEVL